MSTNTVIVDNLARLIGLAFIGQGVGGVLNPVSNSGGFGLPLPSAESTLFFPAVASRNIAFGASILGLSWQGQRQAIATVMAGIVIAGVADVQLAVQKGGRWQQHAIGTVVCGALGWALYQAAA